MTKFNADLNNLFKNYQQQNTYSKYEKASAKDKKNKSLWESIDTNKDGKINSTDKKKLDDTKTKLLKKENLFDINGDGKFNQKDIDMFIKGDINGDGKVSNDEWNFISAYKDAFAAAMTKKTSKNYSVKKDGTKMISTETDIQYTNGIRTKQVNTDKNGTTNTYTFASDGKTITGGVGKKTDGTVVNYTYKKGVRVSAVRTTKDGTVVNYTYKDGVKSSAVKTLKDGTKTVYTYDKDGKSQLANGLVEDKYYKDGKLFTGTTKSGVTYKKGVFQYSIKDNNGSGYPKVSGNTILCKNDKKEVKITVNVGEKAVINKNGTVTVTKSDGKTQKIYNSKGTGYDGTVDGKMYKNGSLANTVVNGVNYRKGVPSSGEVDGLYYGTDGKLFNGLKNNTMYVNGYPFSGAKDVKYNEKNQVISFKVDDDRYGGMIYKLEYSSSNIVSKLTEQMANLVSNCQISKVTSYDKLGYEKSSQMRIYQPETNKTNIISYGDSYSYDEHRIITDISFNQDGSLKIVYDKGYGPKETKIYVQTKSTGNTNTYEYVSSVNEGDQFQIKGNQMILKNESYKVDGFSISETSYGYVSSAEWDCCTYFSVTNKSGKNFTLKTVNNVDSSNDHITRIKEYGDKFVVAERAGKATTVFVKVDSPKNTYLEISTDRYDQWDEGKITYKYSNGILQGYNTKGKLTQKFEIKGNKLTFTNEGYFNNYTGYYDIKKGKALEDIYYEKDGDFDFKFTYSYPDNNSVVEKFYSGREDSLYSTGTYKFDSQGKRTYYDVKYVRDVDSYRNETITKFPDSFAGEKGFIDLWW